MDAQRWTRTVRRRAGQLNLVGVVIDHFLGPYLVATACIMGKWITAIILFLTGGLFPARA